MLPILFPSTTTPEAPKHMENKALATLTPAEDRKLLVPQASVPCYATAELTNFIPVSDDRASINKDKVEQLGSRH